MSWYSRRGMPHSDDYFACCGVRKGREVCLRAIWPVPSAVHTGHLFIPSSRKKGGGAPQWGMNHIPRGATPTWTCCGRLATSPGCAGDLVDFDSDYDDTIRLWEEQYEVLLFKERDMLIDGFGAAIEHQ